MYLIILISFETHELVYRNKKTEKSFRMEFLNKKSLSSRRCESSKTVDSIRAAGRQCNRLRLKYQFIFSVER